MADPTRMLFFPFSFCAPHVNLLAYSMCEKDWACISLLLVPTPSEFCVCISLLLVPTPSGSCSLHTEAFSLQHGGSMCAGCGSGDPASVQAGSPLHHPFSVYDPLASEMEPKEQCMSIRHSLTSRRPCGKPAGGWLLATAPFQMVPKSRDLLFSHFVSDRHTCPYFSLGY